MSLVIKSEKRDSFGKNASRRIRKGGLIPVILYGEGGGNVPLVVSKKDIVKILKSESGENTIFRIAFDSEETDVMIKALQLDSTTDELLHADLIKIVMDKEIRVQVPIELVGEAIGVKSEGGFVDFMAREVEIECLPGNIPDHLTIDISELHLHQAVKAAEVVTPEGVKLLTDPAAVIVMVQVPHEEKVEAKPEEEAAAEAAATAEPAEPEVIKKERAPKEEEEKA